MDKAILTCALNGVLTDPTQHPVPVTPAECAASAREAMDAGASVIHIHYRQQAPGKGHLPSWQPEVAREIVDAIRDACPGIIINSTTGVGGLTLGGGFGRLGRRFGLTLDNALEYDVVTADGKLRRAAPDENPELFWGLRGGGGNFGIVTSFLFRLHPMQRQVSVGRFIFPFAEARQVMNFFAEYADGAPDELQVDGGIGGAPGKDPGVMVSAVWSGDPARTEEIYAPIRKAGTVVSESVQPMDYVALQRSGDYDDPRAFSGYMKSGFTGKLTPALVDDLVDDLGCGGAGDQHL